ncbi:hypothetical protein DAETH_32960 (plasmid) [Deinococcus aetherius]|uniref:DUF3006 domain-containing protein n=1 Tax=Deinococcus aetherius TaxID=200252 RepID=A0ABN6RNX4_9DEIO|nr:DUF3006 domain-containing protein [Deinococcus aetherius]BDP43327.1 hypothetical protein DAETH_32960 [Deinococcus aetherius]
MTSEPPEPMLTGRLTVDALEGHLARVEREDGSLQDWPLTSLPRGVREGDVLRWHVEGRHLTFEIDLEGTRERRQAAQAQLDALNGAVPAGEINL